MQPDDERLGHMLRAIRRRSGQTQEQLAAAASVPVRDLIRLESGAIEEVRVGRVRRLFRAAGGEVRVTVWWNGAAADRLLDARHATLVEQTLAVLSRRGWEAAVELTFSEYGERGSIDVLAGHRGFGTIGVFEIKGSIGSLEETNRKLDVKARLAPKLAQGRFGWRPARVGRVLVVPDESTVRRVIARHAETMDLLYPARSRDVRAWLREPDTALRGIWFLSERPNGETIRR